MSDSFLAIEKQALWNSVLSPDIQYDVLVVQFLTNKLDLDYLSANYSDIDKEHCISIIIDALLATPIPKVKELLASIPFDRKISADNIPEFSNFATAAVYLPEILLSADLPLTNRELGYSLFSETKNDIAAEKYGQTHGNLSWQLGLASIVRNNHKKFFCATPLTQKFCQLDQSKKIELLQRLCFRIPIIHAASVSDYPTDTVDINLKTVLAKSTFIRRRSNVLEVLAFALGE